MDLSRVFAANMKKYRKMLKLSQVEFAGICGLSHSFVVRAEGGKYIISFENMEKIADALGVEVYQLFMEE